MSASRFEPGTSDERTETDGPRRSPSIRVSMMPRDTNWMGTVFGGIILSYIDHAGAVAAQRKVRGRLVTVAMREVVFHEPVFVGDLVSFYTHIVRTGTTSITVHVEVEAERSGGGGERVTVTDAEVVYVHVDDARRPLPIASDRRVES